MALAGIDIDAVMKGFAQAYEDLKNPDLHVNPAYQYAVARRILENQGKDAEMLVTYEPADGDDRRVVEAAVRRIRRQGRPRAFCHAARRSRPTCIR